MVYSYLYKYVFLHRKKRNNMADIPKTSIYGKVFGKSGIARAVAILAVLAAIMLVVVSIPVYQRYKAEADRIACVQSLDSAWRQTAVDYLMNNPNPTAEEVKEVAAKAMLGWEDICPAGGSVYVVENPDYAEKNELPYVLVCGLHGTDRKQCTRLNANNVYEQVVEQVRNERRYGNDYPESVTVYLHHKPLTAYLVDESTGLKRGTGTTTGYKGTVAYYSIVGHSDFGSNSGLEEGRVWYFSYADEEYCANWSNKDGWTGDSYNR